MLTLEICCKLLQIKIKSAELRPSRTVCFMKELICRTDTRHVGPAWKHQVVNGTNDVFGCCRMVYSPSSIRGLV